jgi:hypothetical protein
MATNFARLKPMWLFTVELFGRQAVSGKSAHVPDTEINHSVINWTRLYSDSDKSSEWFPFSFVQSCQSFEDVTWKRFWYNQPFPQMCRKVSGSLMLRGSLIIKAINFKVSRDKKYTVYMWHTWLPSWLVLWSIIMPPVRYRDTQKVL